MYDSLETPYHAYPAMMSSQLVKFDNIDSSGIPLGTNYFLCDTTQLKMSKVLTFCQDTQNNYMVHSVKVNSTFRIAIHKTDLEWNTEYFIVPDTTSALPLSSSLRSIEINKSEPGNLLISALKQTGNLFTALMIELDSAGTVNYAWIGDGNDSIYFDNVIDTTSNTVLFLGAKSNTTITEY